MPNEGMILVRINDAVLVMDPVDGKEPAEPLGQVGTITGMCSVLWR